MDDSPVAQLLRHAEGVQRAHQLLTDVTRQTARQAEDKRPGGQNEDQGQAADA